MHGYECPDCASLTTALATAKRELAEARRERDSERSHHEELSARYHAVCRKTCESLRDQVSTLAAERDTLRAEVERLTRERDAAVHVMEQAEHDAFIRGRDAGKLHADHALTAERDALRAEVERLKAAGAWKPEEFWREEVADEAAEQIAAWLDSGPDLDAPGLQAAASPRHKPAPGGGGR